MTLRLRILVTGFVPFMDDPYNPSGVTAKWLHGQAIHTGKGRSAVFGNIIGRGDIPVRFVDEGRGASNLVENLIVNARPDVVISLGMAAEIFEVEQDAHDLRRDPSIKTGSPGYANHYTTSLPIQAVVRAIESAGGVVQADSDAGAYVCEDVFYHVMRIAASSPGDVRILRAGFIHVPKYVILDNGTVPNRLAPGVNPVAQSLINNAIYRAVEATLADVTEDEYARAHRATKR